MSPSQVISLDLRRALDSGAPDAVLDAVEAALASEAAEALLEQAREAWYSAFWVLVEDGALDGRVAAVELRLAG